VRLSRVVLASLILLLAAGLVASLLTGFFSLGRKAESTQVGNESPAGQSSEDPPVSTPAKKTKSSKSRSTETTPAPPEPGGESQVPTPVMEVAADQGPPDPGRVSLRVATVDRKGLDGLVGAAVIDGFSGKTVYAANASTPMTPASTMKLLTSTAALSLYGPHHRFQTRVVAAKPIKTNSIKTKQSQIVLVGGGDPYLQASPRQGQFPARASLSNLATSTAAALKAKGVRRVSLGYDDTLFTGPAWNRDWPTRYGDQVGPTTSLWISPKQENAAGSAAEAFARALRGTGIAVSTVRRVQAPRSATQIAVVRSLALHQIVTQLLQVSDNNASEVLLRQIGIKAGLGGSITGGRRALRAELTKLGVWAPKTVVRDGSGLARESKVRPETFARLLRLAGSPEQPKLRAVLTGLPVAGVEGSLRTRFVEPELHAADGLVRGKTGTLTGVRSLAGYLRSPDGSLLYYSLVVNNTSDDWVAGVWIQRALVALSRCGCRG
jgi:serine-type D-Ala-D-Ala carboxypeptidase/endopeptidase (penicillin-binding protein 4)